MARNNALDSEVQRHVTGYFPPFWQIGHWRKAQKSVSSHLYHFPFPTSLRLIPRRLSHTLFAWPPPVHRPSSMVDSPYLRPPPLSSSFSLSIASAFQVVLIPIVISGSKEKGTLQEYKRSNNDRAHNDDEGMKA